MERIKEKSLLIAGIMFVAMVVYKLFSTDAYSNSVGFYYFYNLVVSVGFLTLGILCIKGGLEPAKAIVLTVLTVLELISVVVTVFEMFGAMFEYFDIYLIFYVISILSGLLNAAALALLAIMTFCAWKKKTCILDRYWFAPAVISLIPIALAIISRIVSIFVYSASLSISDIIDILLITVVGTVICAVRYAFYGLGVSQKNTENEKILL